MTTTLPQLFGVLPTGNPLITTPSAAPAPSSFLFNLPSTRFSHLVVFLLPGVTLPPNTAAAVYLAVPPVAGQNPDFKFLGGIGPGKESAVFRVSGLPSARAGAQPGEVDMDAPEEGQQQGKELILGISIEPAASVAERIAALPAPSTTTTLVRQQDPAQQRSEALALAQKIIKNAFNFLASYSGNVPVPGAPGNAGVEVVPLKAFEEWWRKFEGKVRNDPGFLERDVD